MRSRSSSARSIALIVVVVVALVGVSGVASAKVKGPKGCHKTHSCKGGSGSGSGSGATPPLMTVAVDPNPLVETGASEIRAVIQVETSASFAGDNVNIDSSQLASSCGGSIVFGSLQPGASYTPDSVQVVLDNDGNVTVSVYGLNCARVRA